MQWSGLSFIAGVLLTATPISAAITVTGTITTPEGSGLEQVQVELLPMKSAFEEGVSILEGRGPAEPIASTKTGPGGRFLLTAPDMGAWKVVASAEGFVPFEYAPLVLTESTELGPAVLRRDSGATIRILDATGAPLDGVWVWAVSSPGYAWPDDGWGWEVSPRVSRTDGMGYVTLSRAKGEKLDLVVFEAGASWSRSLVEGGEVRLEPEAETRWIEARNIRGEPLEGVLARLGEHGAPVGLTGPDGRLRIPVSAEGTTEVLLLSEQGHRRVELLPARAEDPEPRIVVLADPRLIVGRVLDESSGKPLAGALVWPGGEPGRFVRSDDLGRYQLALSMQSRWFVQAEAAQHVPRAIRLERDDLDSGRAPALALAPQVRITGKVVDPRGKPVADALLEAVADSGRRPFFRPSRADGRSSSLADGLFVVTGLTRGKSYQLRASKPGFLTATVKVVAPAAPRPATPSSSAAEEAGSPKRQPAAVKERRRGLRLVLSPARGAFGRVVDENEMPLADAEVTLAVGGPPRPSWLRQKGELGAEVFHGRTEDHGRFEIAELPADTVNIKVVRVGFTPMTVRNVAIPSDDGAVDLGTFVLVAGVSLTGRVVDGEGKGIRDVAVYVVEGSERPEFLGEEIRQRLAENPSDAVTDEVGNFEVKGLVAEEQIHILADRSGYSPVWLEGVELPSEEPLILTMETAFEVKGQIVDEAGEPVGDAEVRLELVTEPPEKGLPPRSIKRLHNSDTDGEFVIDGVSAGKWTLHADAQGFVPFGPMPLEIPAAAQESITVVLERGAVLEGRVETSEGEPIAEVRVVTDQHMTYSDAEGFYRIAGLPPGPNRLEASHPHYERLIRSIEIEPDLNTLDLTFEKGQPVGGRVVDGEGLPVAGAQVAMIRETVRGVLDYRATTVEDGSFRLASVVGGEYQLDVEKQGFAPSWKQGAVLVDGKPVEDLEVVLERGTTVSGRVLGLDFEELSRVQIEATSEFDRAVAGKLDYEGRYEIHDLPSGSWLVRATLPGGRRQVQVRLDIERGLRELTRDLEFKKRLTLSGRVLHDGEPVQSTTVSLTGYDVAVRRSVKTDHQGEFRIDDLFEGSYHLGLSQARELLIHNQEIRLTADREIDINLEPARIGGTVIDETSGTGIKMALVILRRLSESRGGQGMLTTGTESEGDFYFPRVPPGRYRLTVRKDGFAALEQEIEVASGAELNDLVVKVRATQGLTLNVRLASGAMPPFVTAAVFDPSGKILLEESRGVDEQGIVRLPTVPPGRFELMVSAPGSASATATVTVPGEPVPFVLAPAGRLEVRVPALATSDVLATLQLLGPDGHPVRLLDASEGLTEEWSLTAGRTRVDGVPEGVWKLLVTAADGQRWWRSVVAVPDVATEVVLE